MATKELEVRSQCQKLVIENALEITQKLIDKAMEGSQQHAKFLFDFAFADARSTKEEDDDLPGPSLAEILLERLRQLEESPELEECARA